MRLTAVTRSDHLTARVYQRWRLILLLAVTAAICENSCVRCMMLPGFFDHWTHCRYCSQFQWRHCVLTYFALETNSLWALSRIRVLSCVLQAYLISGVSVETHTWMLRLTLIKFRWRVFEIICTIKDWKQMADVKSVSKFYNLLM
jgi:hypothetical protein